MKILLVGNYLIDRQESMQRFTQMLAEGMSHLGHEVRVIRPEPAWIKLTPAFMPGLAKWLGYLDKFLAFPIALKTAIAWADVVHICDHSNAFYTRHLQSVPHLVTCHDLAAVRGALGEDTDCPVSVTGKILQRWILSGLRQADLVVCDSTHTKQDLERLAGGDMAQRSKLLLLGLNHTYQQIPAAAIAKRLQAFGQLDLNRPYLLNVGSSLLRKNREGILQIFKQVSTELPQMQMVFAGSPLTVEQAALAQDLGLSDRLVQIIKPDNSQLEALYNQAFALIFPSRFEGFGWPVIEAQACGCPVLCSDRTSLPEVAGAGAILKDADDIAGFAQTVIEMFKHKQQRQDLIHAGFANIKRFDPQIMIQKYAAIYAELLNSQGDRQTARLLA
jgi:glycosyltransferase involved in cell wall biosynthesis